jgi:DHA2 family multidrug resistance protein
MAEITSIFYGSIRKENHLFLLLILLIPLSLSGGIASLASTYITGSTSAIPADVSMATFAQAIGLVLGIPGIFTLKKVVSSRRILLVVFSALFVINLAIGYTDEPLIIVMASFVGGFFKIIGLLEVINALLPILMPHGERHRLYSIYYPVTLVAGQLTSVIIVHVANLYNWQLGQLLLNVSLIAGLLLVIFVIHPWHIPEKGQFAQFDWFDLTLIAIGMLLLSYVLNYGVTYDWLASPKILGAAIGWLLALALILIRTILISQPAVDLTILSYGNVRFGLFVLFLLSLLSAGNNIQNTMLSTLFKGNVVEINRINFYVTGGYIIGGPIGYIYYTYFKSFKAIAIFTIACYALSFVILYFLSASIVESGAFYLPAVLRGLAVVLSYMAVGVYISEGIPQSYFLSLLFFYLFTRNFFGPAFWSAVISYIYYHRFVYYIDRLASKIELGDANHNEIFGPSFQSAIRAGFGTDQAVNISSGSVYSRVASQAILLTSQEIFGGLILFCFIVIIVILAVKVYETNKHIKNEFVLP